VEEAEAFLEWLLHATRLTWQRFQVMYDLYGEVKLDEKELSHLGGYRGARPVRVGNAAHEQLQLDIFGEIMDAMHAARHHGVNCDEDSWNLEINLMEYLETFWRDPDEGIWEVRGPRRHFTHSKVMAWVAADRTVKAIEHYNLPGDADRWRKMRDEIHADVCQRGYNERLHSFVQYYGSEETDASLLMLPLVGFLPAAEERMKGTVEFIEKTLLEDGLVLRYKSHESVDGLPPGEAAFLPCTFWLADNYWLLGRHDEARKLFERLLSLANDVGLLAEEYGPQHQRLLGNFPQAFTHVALVNTALNLSPDDKQPAKERQRA
jgi:GH15 family glucan-1,4-alpha-glucosidase